MNIIQKIWFGIMRIIGNPYIEKTEKVCPICKRKMERVTQAVYNESHNTELKPYYICPYCDNIEE